MNFKKAVMVDMDGTLFPGTEDRNRAALQGLVDTFTKATGKNRFFIPWDHCNGQDEQRIHAILIEQGLEGFESYRSARDFQIEAKRAYGEVANVDYSPRPGMINVLQYLSVYGVTSVLVTNSDKESANKALTAGFEIASGKRGVLIKPEDIFPLIITKTDVLEAGMQPKPNPDPFILAEQRLKAALPHNYLSSGLYRPTEWHYQRKDMLILEDSGTGTAAGFAYTGQRNQVVKFNDKSLPCDNAGHNVNNMTECAQAMCHFYGIAEPHKTTPLQDTLMRMALQG